MLHLFGEWTVQTGELSVKLGERCICTCVSAQLAPNVVDIQTKSILVVIAACHDC